MEERFNSYVLDWESGSPSQFVVKSASYCDNACPSTESEETVQGQNYGCLPCPYEIKQMLLNKKVWMCHSNSSRPCVATGLSQLPDGYEAVTEY